MSPTSRTSPGFSSAASLAIVVIAAAIARAQLDSGEGPYGLDGSYYLQVARNFSEGRGLVTSVDLYHQALPSLPAPTNIYPLWPLLLGSVMKVVGADLPISVLPRICYVASLVMLGLLVLAIERSLPASRASRFSTAPLVVGLFATVPMFWSSTTFPYTEGLGFTLCFAALAVLGTRPTGMRVFASGALAGMAYLSRSQFLLMLLAIAGALLLASLLEKRRTGRLVAFVAGASFPIAAWAAWVSTFTTFTPRLLWANYRPSPAIAEYQQAVVLPSVGATLIDRLGGVLVAWNPASPYSFFALFGPAAVVALAGILVLLPQAKHWKRAFDDDRLIATATLLAGAATAGVLVTAHQRFFLPWLFGWRHGLVLILVLAVAIPLLWQSPRKIFMILTLAVVGWSIVAGGSSIYASIAKGPARGPAPSMRLLTDWIDANATNATFLATNAQQYGPYSRANFRWTACDADPRTTFQLLTLVRTDYVIVHESEQPCAFIRGAARALAPVAAFGSTPNRFFLFRNVLQPDRGVPHSSSAVGPQLDGIEQAGRR